MGFMRFDWRWGAPFVPVLVAAAINCAPSGPDYPPPGMCNPALGPCPMSSAAGAGIGSATATTGVGGGLGTGGSTGTGVGAGTPVSGNLDLITEPDFIDSALVPAHGTGTISAYLQAGGTVTINYGTAMGAGGGSGAASTFSFAGLPAGLTWFYVKPANTASALQTLSEASLPIPGTFTLPVVDPSNLQTIASNLPSLAAAGLSATASQIVVRITNAGMPYAGVSMKGATGGAVVVYDTGDGVYSDSSTATGTAGTIILFNSGLLGRQVLTFTDMNMKVNEVTILAGQGAVTLATLDWQ